MVRSGSPCAPRVLVSAVFVLGLSAGPALAQGTPEQREACTPDALKLCQDTIPDVARTEACMKRHEAELSPRCHAAFIEPSAPAATRRAARAAPEEREAAPPSRLPDERRQARREAPGENEPGDDEYDAAPHRLGPPEPDAREAGGPPDSYDESPFGPRRLGPPGSYGGGPPDGYGEPYPGPRGYGPPDFGPNGGRFADGGPPNGREPPDVRRYRYGPPDTDASEPHGGRHARVALLRLCARDMIDPRTCALVRRALAEER